MLLLHLLALEKRTLKHNLQHIISTLEQLGDIGAVLDEHVIGAQDLSPIEGDGRIRVQALEHEHLLLAGRGQGRREHITVDPVLLADPLARKLVLVEERVRDQVVVQQVEVHIGRELGDGEEVALVGALEQPAGAEGGDGAQGGHGGRGGGEPGERVQVGGEGVDAELDQQAGVGSNGE